MLCFLKKHRKRAIVRDSDEESSSQSGPIQGSHNILPSDRDVDIHHQDEIGGEKEIDDRSVDPETNCHGDGSFISDQRSNLCSRDSLRNTLL